MKDDKATRAIKAAAEVFLRHGYAGTTMGAIATAASMSRPALYLLFPGKEQVFSAATMFLAKQRREEIRHELETCEGLEQKLTTACEMLLVGVFEMQQSIPDAKDMDNLAFPVVREIYAMFETFFADILVAENASIAGPPERVARLLVFGLRGLREVARSADDFRELIRLNIAMVCRSLLRPEV